MLLARPTLKRIVVLTLITLVALTLAACKGSDDPGLIDSSWVLEALNGNPPIPGTVVRIEFTKGKVSGSSGCNTYNGTYTARGGNMQITNVFATMIACLDANVQAQENEYLTTLALAASYEIINDRLFIYDGAGNQIIVFTREQTGETRP
jgi:heat shock protein HslJ